MAVVASVTVTMDDRNEIRVSGQIPDKIVALGLLEAAKALVLRGPEPKQGPRIVPGTVLPPVVGPGVRG